MKINVTQEDIDLGIRRGCYDCPVARAIVRDLNLPNNDYGDSVKVLRNLAIFYVRGDNQGITLPQEVYDFIGLFDAGGKASPFSFDLEYEAQ